MQILVLGMHRSGTSMVARLLNMMGAYFPRKGLNASASEKRKLRVVSHFQLYR
jgi:hypothetical protein